VTLIIPLRYMEVLFHHFLTTSWRVGYAQGQLLIGTGYYSLLYNVIVVLAGSHGFSRNPAATWNCAGARRVWNRLRTEGAEFGVALWTAVWRFLLGACAVWSDKCSNRAENMKSKRPEFVQPWDRPSSRLTTYSDGNTQSEPAIGTANVQYFFF